MITKLKYTFIFNDLHILHN